MPIKVDDEWEQLKSFTLMCLVCGQSKKVSIQLSLTHVFKNVYSLQKAMVSWLVFI